MFTTPNTTAEVSFPVSRRTLIDRRFSSAACGQIFCDTCTTHRAVVPLLASNTAERVCDECYREFKAHLLSPTYQSNHQVQDLDDSLNIDDEASSNAMTSETLNTTMKRAAEIERRELFRFSNSQYSENTTIVGTRHR